MSAYSLVVIENFDTTLGVPHFNVFANKAVRHAIVMLVFRQEDVAHLLHLRSAILRYLITHRRKWLKELLFCGHKQFPSAVLH